MRHGIRHDLLQKKFERRCSESFLLYVDSDGACDLFVWILCPGGFQTGILSDRVTDLSDPENPWTNGERDLEKIV